MEHEEITPEKVEENTEVKVLEKVPEKSEPSSKSIEIYDLDSGKLLDFNKTVDRFGYTYGPTLHIYEERDGKIYVKTTKTGKLRRTNMADQQAYKDKVAERQAQVEEANARKLEEIKQSNAEIIDDRMKKERCQKMASYTASVLCEIFYEFGSWFFGRSFVPPETPEGNAETNRLHKAATRWVEYRNIELNPDYDIAAAVLGHIMRHKPEPGSPASKYKIFNVEPDKVEVVEDDEHEDS